jgi:hypothetical protein
MSDPVCCILGVCCPPGSDRQRDTLAAELSQAVNYLEPDKARQCADWIVDHFDLAPPGSLDALKGALVRMVKAGAKE